MFFLFFLYLQILSSGFLVLTAAKHVSSSDYDILEKRGWLTRSKIIHRLRDELQDVHGGKTLDTSLFEDFILSNHSTQFLKDLRINNVDLKKAEDILTYYLVHYSDSAVWRQAYEIQRFLTTSKKKRIFKRDSDHNFIHSAKKYIEKINNGDVPCDCQLLKRFLEEVLDGDIQPNQNQKANPSQKRKVPEKIPDIIPDSEEIAARIFADEDSADESDEDEDDIGERTGLTARLSMNKHKPRRQRNRKKKLKNMSKLFEDSSEEDSPSVESYEIRPHSKKKLREYDDSASIEENNANIEKVLQNKKLRNLLIKLLDIIRNDKRKISSVEEDSEEKEDNSNRKIIPILQYATNKKIPIPEINKEISDALNILPPEIIPPEFQPPKAKETFQSGNKPWESPQKGGSSWENFQKEDSPLENSQKDKTPLEHENIQEGETPSETLQKAGTPLEAPSEPPQKDGIPKGSLQTDGSMRQEPKSTTTGNALGEESTIVSRPTTNIDETPANVDVDTTADMPALRFLDEDLTPPKKDTEKVPKAPEQGNRKSETPDQTNKTSSRQLSTVKKPLLQEVGGIVPVAIVEDPEFKRKMLAMNQVAKKIAEAKAAKSANDKMDKKIGQALEDIGIPTGVPGASRSDETTTEDSRRSLKDEISSRINGVNDDLEKKLEKVVDDLGKEIQTEIAPRIDPNDEAIAPEDSKKSLDGVAPSKDLRKSLNEATTPEDLRKSLDRATTPEDSRKSLNEATTIADLEARRMGEGVTLIPKVPPKDVDDLVKSIQEVDHTITPDQLEIIANASQDILRRVQKKYKVSSKDKDAFEYEEVTTITPLRRMENDPLIQHDAIKNVDDMIKKILEEEPTISPSVEEKINEKLDEVKKLIWDNSEATTKSLETEELPEEAKRRQNEATTKMEEEIIDVLAPRMLSDSLSSTFPTRRIVITQDMERKMNRDEDLKDDSENKEDAEIRELLEDTRRNLETEVASEEISTRLLGNVEKLEEDMKNAFREMDEEAKKRDEEAKRRNEEAQNSPADEIKGRQLDDGSITLTVTQIPGSEDSFRKIEVDAIRRNEEVQTTSGDMEAKVRQLDDEEIKGRQLGDEIGSTKNLDEEANGRRNDLTTPGITEGARKMGETTIIPEKVTDSRKMDITPEVGHRRFGVESTGTPPGITEGARKMGETTVDLTGTTVPDETIRRKNLGEIIIPDAIRRRMDQDTSESTTSEMTKETEITDDIRRKMSLASTEVSFDTSKTVIEDDIRRRMENFDSSTEITSTEIASRTIITDDIRKRMDFSTEAVIDDIHRRMFAKKGPVTVEIRRKVPGLLGDPFGTAESIDLPRKMSDDSVSTTTNVPSGVTVLPEARIFEGTEGSPRKMGEEHISTTSNGPTDVTTLASVARKMAESDSTQRKMGEQPLQTTLNGPTDVTTLPGVRKGAESDDIQRKMELEEPDDLSPRMLAKTPSNRRWGNEQETTFKDTELLRKNGETTTLQGPERRFGNVENSTVDQKPNRRWGNAEATTLNKELEADDLISPRMLGDKIISEEVSVRFLEDTAETEVPEVPQRREMETTVPTTVADIAARIFTESGVETTVQKELRRNSDSETTPSSRRDLEDSGTTTGNPDDNLRRMMGSAEPRSMTRTLVGDETSSSSIWDSPTSPEHTTPKMDTRRIENEEDSTEILLPGIRKMESSTNLGSTESTDSIILPDSTYRNLLRSQLNELSTLQNMARRILTENNANLLALENNRRFHQGNVFRDLSTDHKLLEEEAISDSDMISARFLDDKTTEDGKTPEAERRNEVELTEPSPERKQNPTELPVDSKDSRRNLDTTENPNPEITSVPETRKDLNTPHQDSIDENSRRKEEITSEPGVTTESFRKNLEEVSQVPQTILEDSRRNSETSTPAVEFGDFRRNEEASSEPDVTTEASRKNLEDVSQNLQTVPEDSRRNLETSIPTEETRKEKENFAEVVESTDSSKRRIEVAPERIPVKELEKVLKEIAPMTVPPLKMDDGSIIMGVTTPPNVLEQPKIDELKESDIRELTTLFNNLRKSVEEPALPVNKKESVFIDPESFTTTKPDFSITDFFRRVYTNIIDYFTGTTQKSLLDEFGAKTEDTGAYSEEEDEGDDKMSVSNLSVLNLINEILSKLQTAVKIIKNNEKDVHKEIENSKNRRLVKKISKMLNNMVEIFGKERGKSSDYDSFNVKRQITSKITNLQKDLPDLDYTDYSLDKVKAAVYSELSQQDPIGTALKDLGTGLGDTRKDVLGNNAVLASLIPGQDMLLGSQTQLGNQNPLLGNDGSLLGGLPSGPDPILGSQLDQSKLLDLSGIPGLRNLGGENLKDQSSLLGNQPSSLYGMPKSFLGNQNPVTATGLDLFSKSSPLKDRKDPLGSMNYGSFGPGSNRFETPKKSSSLLGSEPDDILGYRIFPIRRSMINKLQKPPPGALFVPGPFRRNLPMLFSPNDRIPYMNNPRRNDGNRFSSDFTKSFPKRRSVSSRRTLKPKKKTVHSMHIKITP